MKKYIKLFGKFIANEFKEILMGIHPIALGFILFLSLSNLAGFIYLLRTPDFPNRGCQFFMTSIFTINWLGVFIVNLRHRKQYLEMKSIKVEPMYAICEVCGGKTCKIHVYEAPNPNSEYGKYWEGHETLCMCEKCANKYFGGCHEDWTEPQKKNWLHAQTKALFEAVHAQDKIRKESENQPAAKKEGES